MRKTLRAGLRTSEAKIVLVLLASIITADCFLRGIDARLSGNIAHIESIPSLVRELSAHDNRSMLILGNSLTKDGVHEQTIAARLDVDVAKITPDGTGLWDWQCLLQHEVLNNSGADIDTLVIGYAWQLLSDQTRVDPSRLGAHFCELSDLSQPRSIGLASFGDTGELVLARASRIYALREVLRHRILSILIPSYETFTQQANAAGAERVGEPQPEQTYTYERFAALAATLQKKGTRVVVVALPVQSGYHLDEELDRLADNGTIALIDLRDIEGLDASAYRDSMHLNDRGQALLTERLAERLASLLKKPS